MTEDLIRIDLGCGLAKIRGTIGIDINPGPGVDLVLDLTKQPLPFGDQTVGYVHSAHFFEHIEAVLPIFTEISRVCAEGAKLEFWTPYAWSNSAFVFGHVTSFAEDTYLHFDWHSDLWRKSLGAFWVFTEIRYVINPDVLVYLYQKGISLDFAIKHLKDVALEFGIFAIVSHEEKKPNVQKLRRTFSTGRINTPFEIKQEYISDDANPNILDMAIAANTV